MYLYYTFYNNYTKINEVYQDKGKQTIPRNTPFFQGKSQVGIQPYDIGNANLTTGLPGQLSQQGLKIFNTIQHKTEENH